MTEFLLHVGAKGHEIGGWAESGGALRCSQKSEIGMALFQLFCPPRGEQRMGPRLNAESRGRGMKEAE